MSATSLIITGGIIIYIYYTNKQLRERRERRLNDIKKRQEKRLNDIKERQEKIKNAIEMRCILNKITDISHYEYRKINATISELQKEGFYIII